MKVRAKFRVDEIRLHAYYEHARTVVMTPHYDPSIPEDARYAKATPSGRLEMFVDNPAALAELQLGKFVYLDFTPVEQMDTPIWERSLEERIAIAQARWMFLWQQATKK